jgi:LmbE family N-acetylglucosaminyl deacetylase
MQIAGTKSIVHAYPHVYVSPHLDDVAWSCAGHIARCRSAGERVLVITVFTGTGSRNTGHYPAALSVFADLPRRLAEDRAAMCRLDADFLWLDYPEHLFREPYPMFAQLQFLAAGRPADNAFSRLVTSTLIDVCVAAKAENIYLPLGVGHHPDHRMISATALPLHTALGSQATLRFYEDIPYAFVANALRHRFRALRATIAEADRPADLPAHKRLSREVHETLDGIGRLHFMHARANRLLGRVIIGALLWLLFAVGRIPVPRAHSRMRLRPETFDVSQTMPDKLGAVSAYATQIPAIMGDIEQLQNHYRSYAQSLGAAHGQFLERYWRLLPLPSPHPVSSATAGRVKDWGP